MTQNRQRRNQMFEGMLTGITQVPAFSDPIRGNSKECQPEEREVFETFEKYIVIAEIIGVTD